MTLPDGNIIAVAARLTGSEGTERTSTSFSKVILELMETVIKTYFGHHIMICF